MNNKARYVSIQEHKALPIFAKSWWLDAVVGKEAWDVAIAEDKQGNIEGIWAYCFKKQFGFKRIFMPPFTPYLGPVMLQSVFENEYQQRSAEHRIMASLLAQIPECRDIRQKFQPELNNWLPFRWEGFKQTTTYTYLIRDTHNPAAIFDGFKDTLQRQIRKAEKKVNVFESDNFRNPLKLMQRSVSQQGASLNISEAYAEKIDKACQQHQSRLILEAKDETGNLHAALYLVFDQQSMHYLYGGYEQTFADSGAMSLLFWKAIQVASEKGLSFNFEGSMLQGVERYFRSFGGNLVPVHFVYQSKFPFNLISI